MSELEQLTFQLEQKQTELRKTALNTFVFNPNTMQLVKEIYDLQEKIDLLKAEDNTENE